MNVRYSLGDYTLKVLGCDKSLDVLDFYYRNRNDFDIYESDKPEAFYTEEFIKNMLNAESKALMSLHFVRFFLYLMTIPTTLSELFLYPTSTEAHHHLLIWDIK